MKKIFITIIYIYKIFFSMFCNGCCRFYPSCSTYAKQAIEKKGVTIGIYLTIKRLIRCNPITPGGYDPI